MRKGQQEILLIIATSFSSALWQKNNSHLEHLPSESEFLESACWTGILSLSLPEVFKDCSDISALHLWKISAYDNFIKLDLAESDFQKDTLHTINPYMICKSYEYN